jgi:hypothetical protein
VPIGPASSLFGIGLAVATGGDTTPWYPTAKIFRQARIGDWGTVFAEITAELRQVVAARRV